MIKRRDDLFGAPSETAEINTRTPFQLKYTCRINVAGTDNFGHQASSIELMYRIIDLMGDQLSIDIVYENPTTLEKLKLLIPNLPLSTAPSSFPIPQGDKMPALQPLRGRSLQIGETGIVFPKSAFEKMQLGNPCVEVDRCTKLEGDLLNRVVASAAALDWPVYGITSRGDLLLTTIGPTHCYPIVQESDTEEDIYAGANLTFGTEGKHLKVLLLDLSTVQNRIPGSSILNTEFRVKNTNVRLCTVQEAARTLGTFGMSGGYDEEKHLAQRLNVWWCLDLQPFRWQKDQAENRFWIKGILEPFRFQELKVGTASLTINDCAFYMYSRPYLLEADWHEPVNTAPTGVAVEVDSDFADRRETFQAVLEYCQQPLSSVQVCPAYWSVGRIAGEVAVVNVARALATIGSSGLILLLIPPSGATEYISNELVNSEISYIDIRTVKAVDIESEIKSKVVVLRVGRVPPPFFFRAFQLATLPAMFEGQNTASLALSLGKPYLHLTVTAQHVQYPDLGGGAETLRLFQEQVALLVNQQTKPQEAWSIVRNCLNMQYFQTLRQEYGAGQLDKLRAAVKFARDCFLSKVSDPVATGCLTTVADLLQQWTPPSPDTRQ